MATDDCPGSYVNVGTSAPETLAAEAAALLSATLPTARPADRRDLERAHVALTVARELLRKHRVRVVVRVPATLWPACFEAGEEPRSPPPR